MKPIVVDASVVIAGLMKEGSVRDALLNVEDITFSAPSYLAEEVHRHLDEVAARAHIPRATIQVTLEDLLAAIELVPAGVYSHWMDSARDLAGRAGALGDEEYIALSLALEAPVWTLDRDFLRIPGLTVLSTQDIGTASASSRKRKVRRKRSGA